MGELGEVSQRTIQLGPGEVHGPVFTRLWCITFQSPSTIQANGEVVRLQQPLASPRWPSCGSLPAAPSTQSSTASPITTSPSAPPSLSYLPPAPLPPPASLRNGSCARIPSSLSLPLTGSQNSLPQQLPSHQPPFPNADLKRSSIVTFILLSLAIFIVCLALLVAGVLSSGRSPSLFTFSSFSTEQNSSTSDEHLMGKLVSYVSTKFKAPAAIPHHSEEEKKKGINPWWQQPLSLRQQCMEIKWPQIRSSDSTDHYFSLFIAPITPDRPAHHNFQGFCKIDTSLNFGACASGLRGILASSQLAAQTKIGAFQRIQPFSSFFRSGVLEFCLPTIHISSCEKNGVEGMLCQIAWYCITCILQNLSGTCRTFKKFVRPYIRIESTWWPPPTPSLKQL